MSLGASFQLHYYYFLSRLPAGLTTNATLLSLFWVEVHGRDGDYFKHSLLIVLLNRLLTWEHNGIAYEPDPRHAELLIRGVLGRSPRRC